MMQPQFVPLRLMLAIAVAAVVIASLVWAFRRSRGLGFALIGALLLGGLLFTARASFTRHEQTPAIVEVTRRGEASGPESFAATIAHSPDTSSAVERRFAPSWATIAIAAVLFVTFAGAIFGRRADWGLLLWRAVSLLLLLVSAAVLFAFFAMYKTPRRGDAVYEMPVASRRAAASAETRLTSSSQHEHHGREDHRHDAAQVIVLPSPAHPAPTEPTTTEPPAGEAAVVTTPAPAPAAEAPTPVGPPHPAWVDRPGQMTGGVYRVTAKSGLYATRLECERALDVAMHKAADQYVDDYLGEGASALVATDSSWLKNNVQTQEYSEEVNVSIGPMQQVYALLEFNEAARRYLSERLREALVRQRLWFLGTISVLALAVLGSVFGYLKLDMLTAGRQRPRLQFAAATAILMASAGALLVRWAAPF